MSDQICPRCGTTMCEKFDEREVKGMTVCVPNGKFSCMRCGYDPSAAEPQKAGEIMDQELKLAMEHLHACRDNFARHLYAAREANQALAQDLTSMEVASERVIALINVAKKAVE